MSYTIDTIDINPAPENATKLDDEFYASLVTRFRHEYVGDVSIGSGLVGIGDFAQGEAQVACETELGDGLYPVTRVGNFIVVDTRASSAWFAKPDGEFGPLEEVAVPKRAPKKSATKKSKSRAA